MSCTCRIVRHNTFLQHFTALPSFCSFTHVLKHLLWVCRRKAGVASLSDLVPLDVFLNTSVNILFHLFDFPFPFLRVTNIFFAQLALRRHRSQMQRQKSEVSREGNVFWRAPCASLQSQTQWKGAVSCNLLLVPHTQEGGGIKERSIYSYYSLSICAVNRGVGGLSPSSDQPGQGRVLQFDHVTVS